MPDIDKHIASMNKRHSPNHEEDSRYLLFWLPYLGFAALLLGSFAGLILEEPIEEFKSLVRAMINGF